MDDVKSTEEVVKPQTSESDVKITPEEYEKLKEIERNKTIALSKEREARELSKKELEELRAFKKQQEEAEAIKRGEYEKILAEKNSKLEELEKKAKEYDAYIETQAEKQKQKLTQILEKVPESVKEKYSHIADKLPLEERIDFYTNIVKDVKAGDFSQKPKDTGVEVENKELEIAKSKGFDSYLSSLLKI